MSSIVSLIVPVADRRYFKECLDSIHRQTYHDIEILIIDDSQKTGAAAARNRGIEKATGEYIAFCDADDYLEPDAIENMVKSIGGVDLVLGSFRKFGAFEEIVEYDTTEMTLPEVSAYVMDNLRNPRHYQMLSGCWAKLYRRHLVVPFPPLTTAEDMAFNFEYLRRCRLVKFISDIVYNNRKHSGTLTTTFDEKNKNGLFGFLEALKYVDRFLTPYVSQETRTQALDSSKVYHSVLYALRICCQLNRLESTIIKRTIEKIYGEV